MRVVGAHLVVREDQVAAATLHVERAAQVLLGYEIAPPFLGMVTASHPRKALEPGWVPPIVAQAPKP